MDGGGALLPGFPDGPRLRLGRILISRGLLHLRQLTYAVEVQRLGLAAAGIEPGERLGTILVRLGYVEAMDLVRALCDQSGVVNFLVFNRYLMEPPLARAIPRPVAHDLMAMPLVRMPEENYLVASPGPVSTVTRVRLERRLGGRVDPIAVRERDFHAAIDACYDALKRRGTTPVRLGEILVRDRLVPPERLQEALAAARQSGRPLGEVLAERGLVNERLIYRLLACQRGLRLVSAHEVVDPRAAAPFIKRLSPPYVRHHQVLPYRQAGSTVLAVTSDPNVDAQLLADALGCRSVALELACRSELKTLVDETLQIAG